MRPEDHPLAGREALPDALRILVEEFPREGWEAHGNFGELIRFWLDRHIMFRRLTGVLRDDLEARIGGGLDPQAHRLRLAQLGNHLLGDLHAHHSIEDHHFFPRLAALEPRLDWGFSLLEADHLAIDPALHGFAEAANAVLHGGEPGPLADRLGEIERLLDRHLDDEEDLVVPVLLKTGAQL